MDVKNGKEKQMNPVLLSLPPDISLVEVMESEDLNVLTCIYEYFHNRRGFLFATIPLPWISEGCRQQMEASAKRLGELLAAERKRKAEGGAG